VVAFLRVGCWAETRAPPRSACAPRLQAVSRLGPQRRDGSPGPMVHVCSVRSIAMVVRSSSAAVLRTRGCEHSGSQDNIDMVCMTCFMRA
jgi:hypothetical protein